MRILLVDTDGALISTIAQALTKLGHVVDCATDSAAALERTRNRSYDLCVLDDDLSCLEGGGACRTALDSPNQPYVIITAASDASRRITCLLCGADDYLPKPFEPNELLARIAAVQRRQSRTMTYGDLSLDPINRTARWKGEEVTLTAREFDLLSYFVRHPECVHSRNELSAAVWNMPFATGTNIVDVYVNYLRRKLRKFGAPLIHSVRGVGYSFGSPLRP